MAAIVLCVAVASPGYAQVASVDRVSENSDGAVLNAESISSVVSADGRYVAFTTDASNLVDGDANGLADVYLKDLQTGAVTRVSQGLDFSDSNGESGTSPDLNGRGLSISADGRYIAFTSLATNLDDIATDDNGTYDVFLFDRTNSSIALVSRTQLNTFPNAASANPAISADGSIIAFDTIATDIITADFNGKRDVYTYQIGQQSVERISFDSQFGEGNNDSFMPSVNRTGNLVTFQSDATDLVTGDTNGVRDIFLRNLTSDVTTMVSLDISNGPSNGASARPYINADGDSIAFESAASDLVSGDTNSVTDIFVRSLVAGTTIRVSKNSAGKQGNGASAYPSMSSDGRYVAFDSTSTNLVSRDTNRAFDVFLHDRQTATTTRLSLSVNGTQISEGFAADLAGDGRFCVFTSGDESVLVSGDGNFADDIFISKVAQVVTPDLVIDEAPAVRVATPTSVVVTLPKFAGTSLDVADDAAMFDGAVTGEAKTRRKKKLKFKYQVDNEINPDTSDEVRRRLTERNSVTFKNVPSGSHTIRYRLVITRGKKVLGTTPSSPGAGYSIP